MNFFTMLCAVVGFLLVSTAFWWVYRPAGLLVAGALLLAAAFVSATRRRT